MTAVSAIIFDVDGTMLDTREFILQSFEHALSKHGFRISNFRERFAKIVGLPLADCYAALAPVSNVHALCDTHREFQKQRFDLVAAYDGLIEVLSSLQKRGMKLGACSTRASELRSSLKHADVLHYFDAVIDGSEVTNHKPHPESVFKILEQLDIHPSQAVMVGDTPVDIHAGKAAKVAFTVGITHGFATEEQLDESGADKVVHSLRELLHFM
ncbi:MAG: HAD-IA family hydrolase [Patescibacteria group bacterium]